MKEIFKGIAWGLGLSVSAITCITFWVIYIAPLAEISSKNTILESLNDGTKVSLSNWQPEILGYKKRENIITIYSRAKSINELSFMTTRFYLRFTIYPLEENGGKEYPSVCAEQLVTEHHDGEWTYYETDCTVYFSEVKEVSASLAENLRQ